MKIYLPQSEVDPADIEAGRVVPFRGPDRNGRQWYRRIEQAPRPGIVARLVAWLRSFWRFEQ